ncbi:hypothetical protein FRC12_003258 [Ceratobasidium sp. 428]|nr:hypothetical protein FRC12_003258 [Ceratobasidium sp. 428]
MDDDPWGNAAWGSTDAKSIGTPENKPNTPIDLTPTWPVSSVPVPPISDAWEVSPAWGATTTVDDSGGGWGSSLEYHEETVVDETPTIETEVEAEPEEQVIEHLHRPSSPSYGFHNDIPHSPLPSSPPPDGSQTTDSRSSIRNSVDEPPVDEPPITPRIAHIAPPSVSSPSALDDGFGVFESGNIIGLRATAETTDDPWSPSAGETAFDSIHDTSAAEVDPTTNEDAWGSAWPAKREEEEETQPAADEWEIARARKERRDRKISPEVLSGYLTTWEAAVTEIWPDAPPPRNEPTTEWRAPLEDISKLQSLRKIYRLPTMTTTLSSPPPMLSPLPPYSSTQISARQRAAIKATRISAVAQLSPFAHLTSARSIQATHRLSSKATKASISAPRSSLDFGDGVVGVGWAWAHDEKKPEPVAAPAVVAPVSTPSPTPATPGGRFSGFWARARASAERSSVGQGSRSNTPAPLTSPSTSSLGESIKPAAAEPTSLVDPLPAQPVQPTPPPQPEQPAPEQPVSSVSRFFKRFSRSNPLESERVRLATSESVSLSTSDLEFLEDFVPDSNPKSLLDGGRGLTEFDALESMLKSKPLPKEVPVLAPPPRAGTSSGAPSPLAAVPENPNGSDDLWDIFGAPPAPTNGRPSTPLAPAPTTAMPALAPSLTPKITTPVGSAPTSRSHTPRLPSVADLAAVVGGKGSHLRQTSFSTRAQQAFRANVPSLDSPPIPALPPPPTSGLPPSGLGQSVEPDIFSDFIATNTAAAKNSTESSSRLSFDDFGDFESFGPTSIPPAPKQIISSPSPPKPPSKTGTPVFIRTGPNIQRVPDQITTLPPLLPPPPPAPARSGTPGIAPPVRSSTPHIAPPPLAPPPQSTIPQNQPQIDLFDFGSSPPRNTQIPAPSFAATTVNPPKPSIGAKPSTGGGLSASDLSFFEGL